MRAPTLPAIVVGDKKLTLRDAQHEYVFEAVLRRP